MLFLFRLNKNNVYLCCIYTDMGLISSWSNLFSAKKNNDGSWFLTILGSGATWSKKTTQHQKIKAILENPAALYIFLLLPEIFSMGEWKLTKNEKEVEKHPILDLLRKPNPMQTGDQFLWDYMFNRKLGTANLYIDSKVVTENNKMYFLDGDCLKWPTWFENNCKTIFLSDTVISQMHEKEITYKTKEQELKFKYKKLLQFFDISNGVNNWFGSPSRVDALYKIIDNSEKALVSKNINADFMSKFVVAGKAAIENTSQLPMGESDKQSLRDSMRSRENVFPTKTMVDIKRFVENAGVLKGLDEAFMTDAFIIGKMLNIPKDVIEMLGDSTYENQEKARASLISYCIMPDANDLCGGLLEYFGMGDYVLELTYDHLPFVQVFEEQRANTARMNGIAMMNMVSAGVKPSIAYEKIFGEVLKDSDFNDPVRLLGSEQNNNTNLQAV